MFRHLLFADVHGNKLALETALYNVQYDPDTDLLVSIGDVMDRGRHTRECFDMLLQPQRHKTFFIAGNHEAVILEALSGNVTALDSWINSGFGAQATLWSYRFDPSRIATASNNVRVDGLRIRTAADVRAFFLEVFGEDHLKAIESCEYSWILKNVWDGWDCFCCHGGGMLGRRLDSLEDWLLAWGDDAYDRNNDPTLTHKERVVVVYGHYHHHRVEFGPKKICLGVEGEVAIFIPEEGRIVTSDAEEIIVKREWIGI